MRRFFYRSDQLLSVAFDCGILGKVHRVKFTNWIIFLGGGIEWGTLPEIQNSYKTHISYKLHTNMIQSTFKFHTNFIQHTKLIQSSYIIQNSYNSHTNFIQKIHKNHTIFYCMASVWKLYFNFYQPEKVSNKLYDFCMSFVCTLY